VRTRILDLAKKEFSRSITWYDRQREGLGGEFLNDFDTAVAAIQNNPKGYGLMLGGKSKREIRGYVMGRFPFVIVYELLAKEICIIAVAHGQKRPGYWNRRKS
jgi:toxin ParE1/3/4